MPRPLVITTFMGGTVKLRPKLRDSFLIQLEALPHRELLSTSIAPGEGQASPMLLSPILQPRCLGTSSVAKPMARCQVDALAKVMNDEMGQGGRVTCCAESAHGKLDHWCGQRVAQACQVVCFCPGSSFCRKVRAMLSGGRATRMLSYSGTKSSRDDNPTNPKGIMQHRGIDTVSWKMIPFQTVLTAACAQLLRGEAIDLTDQTCRSWECL